LPVILFCDKSGDHASEIIPASPTHIKKMNKKCTTEELAETIKIFGKYSYEDRLSISESTKKKHNKEQWVDKWHQMVYNTLFKINKQPSLEEFFNV